ncbi:3-hydroxyacyl-CoA dehydrogenase family protein [Amycolatopsis sp. CA-126428]|uniref:3-hydroxyacyl-CoA dehydrogenase family protein n=1 Tax=Amycolatopsis sp. CA-126428 TaxID=2073158 RepID=UPI000CD04CFC|nr:3-hydroxyacyl-CoA dehydrogenase family protein [Amycolatopsis sp. CA-126428]
MKIGIVGAGVMGTGVAQCFAAAGHDVVVADADPRALDRGPERIRAGLRMAALLGDRPPATVQDRIRWTGRLAELSGSEFVVECAAERLAVKETLFAELDRLCPAATILASCTSAVPIGRLAAATARADRVIGTHFMNPAPLKDTVEVVRAAATGEETLCATTDLLAGLGKRAIVVADGPGFVANRVLMATINEAIATVGDGIADAGTVDQVFEKCFGHAMGPLRTADLIGLDVILDTLVVLLECTGQPMYRPCPLLTELVGTGRLGRKTGRGLHVYPAG